MTDETPISNIHEFNDELEALMKICDIDSCDVAAALVSAAVIIAARNGCDSYQQRQSIVMLAEHAIGRLVQLNEFESIKH